MFGGGGHYNNSYNAKATVDKYKLGTKTIPTLIGAKYKFNEHTAEHVALTDSITVYSSAINSGYVHLGGTVTI